MQESIRIRLSLGLVGVALIHALACAVLCLGFRVAEQPSPEPWNVPEYREPYCQPPVTAAPPRKLEQPQSVNLTAQSELKQGDLKQQSGCCPPPMVRPGERIVHIGPPRVVPTPTPAPPDPLQRPDTGPPSILNTGAASQPPAKQYQLLLFLDRSSQSQTIHSWFAQHPELSTLRGKSDFQVYTQDSALYQERYARLVPPNQFPAIVLQDASGGHIHACGKSMIPSTPEQLVADMRTGWQLYRQAKAGSIEATGAVRMTGYSWDDQIHPAMRLQTSDACGPDGCPPDRWRPFDRDGGGLFDGVPDAQALLWAGAGDILILALGLIGLVAVVIILTKATRR